jgi:dTMP kinase
MKTMIPNGLFISFEGPEGAGKSTHIGQLAAFLTELGHEVLTTREPGGTGLGEELRGLIKHYGGADSVCPEAELLLFGASRSQLFRQVIQPHLQRGGVVICDRFADSTTVYQGFGRGLDMEFITRMHEFSMSHRWPDLTLLLDVDIETSYSRMASRTGVPGDRIEAAGRRFHEAVRAGFLEQAKRYPERIRVVDSTQPQAQVAAQIRQLTMEKLANA